MNEQPKVTLKDQIKQQLAEKGTLSETDLSKLIMDKNTTSDTKEIKNPSESDTVVK